MANILNAVVGEHTKNLNIKSIDVDTVTFDDGRSSEKVIFVCETDDGREMKISEAWTIDKKGQKKVQGLWVNNDSKGNIAANSILAKLLSFHKKNTLSEFVSTEIVGYPDTNDFTVLTTFDNPVEATVAQGLFTDN